MTKLIPISKFKVFGSSMMPTLRPGQAVMSFNWAYLNKKPKSGEIVVIKLDHKEIIKRVDRVEGEWVFVQGDNQTDSIDSRHFGPVNINQLIGKVVYIDNQIDCINCGSSMVGIAGRKDAICQNCGFKLSCCGEP